MGVLEVRNTNGGILKNYTYQTFLALNPNAKKEILKSLYEQYRHKRIELFCCCNTNAINMSVSYRTETDTYYLKSFPKQAGSHDIDCHFYSESSISSLSNYSKNCIEDEKGNYHINLAAHDYKKLDSKSSLLSSGVGAKTDKIGKSSNKLTTNHLIKIIVTNAWNDYIHFEGANHYPTIKSIFNQIITRTIKKFYISKVNLQQLLFKGGKTGQIYYIEDRQKRNKCYPFVLFLLKDIKEIGEQYQLILEEPINNNRMRFTVDYKLWEETKAATNVSDGPYMVGGFVKSTGAGKSPEFVSMGILPINDYGVPIESSYERKVYNLFCSQHRLVQRPLELDSKFHPQWNGLIPDGLFKDTEKPTIVEVFGMSESDKEYHLHRQYKIELFKELSNYDFWFWDAFNESPLPSLPLKKK